MNSYKTASQFTKFLNYLAKDTTLRLNFFISCFYVKFVENLVEKIDLHLCSALKWERARKKWTSWSGTRQQVISRCVMTIFILNYLTIGNKMFIRNKGGGGDFCAIDNTYKWYQYIFWHTFIWIGGRGKNKIIRYQQWPHIVL